MRRPNRPEPVAPGEALYVRNEREFVSHWTAALSDPPEVYGERITSSGDTVLRRWDPSRSKLGAALANGWDGPMPRSGERWLYLGAATGTTASHVADLVGPDGLVVAVEKSVRPFARLLALAERYPNLGPVLADAREPLAYLPIVPPVDGLYLDLAQADQVEIALANARLFLRPSGVVLLALKTASMGRDRSAREHLDDAEKKLAPSVELEAPLALEPFHRRHFLLGGHPTKALYRTGPEPAPTTRSGLRVARRS
ncbi:MAG TPA: fibrillarin-like rRNA/tRNA 2'-O-methyltransferase [Thermoplasmata archaeon]|nr:fibrillarin-like rRNA/tRNA 2'-O-methyltransferase [Thermoplasmata archaeon]